MVLLLTTDATRWTVMKLSRENSLFELATAGLLLAGGVFGWSVGWRALVRGVRGLVWGFFVVFSLGLLLVGVEELAWGQKIFDYATPAVMEDLNKQQEMTLHNLPGLHGRSDIMWGLFALGGLIGIGLGKVKAFEKIAPPGVLASWFVMILLISLPLTWKDFTGNQNRVTVVLGRMDEFTEMLIAMAACLYLRLCARRMRPPEPPSTPADAARAKKAGRGGPASQITDY